jgi:hypothetical protein
MQLFQRRVALIGSLGGIFIDKLLSLEKTKGGFLLNGVKIATARTAVMVFFFFVPKKPCIDSNQLNILDQATYSR